MHTFVICPLRDSKKVDLEICLAGCTNQFMCNNFNRAVSRNRQEKEKGFVEESTDSPPLKVVAPKVHDKPLATRSDAPEAPPGIEEETVGVPAVLSRSKAEELYEQVLSLKTEIEVRWFELGKILQEIFEGQHYIDLGYATWRDFCEVALGPLELRWRTADYLRTTVMKCKEVGIKKEIAGQIGWSKLKEIVPVVTEKNKDEWIKKAKKKGVTVQILNAQVRVARGKITEEESKVLPEKMFFPLFKEQKEIVELALDVAGHVVASDKKGFLLSDVICPSFLAEYPVGGEVRSRPEMIVKFLERFGAAFKVKFVGEVVDLETGEILVESRE